MWDALLNLGEEFKNIMFKKTIMCSAFALFLSAGAPSAAEAQGFVLMDSGKGNSSTTATREAPSYKGVTVPVDPTAKKSNRRRSVHYGTNNYGGSVRKQQKTGPVSYGSARHGEDPRARTYGSRKAGTGNVEKLSPLRAYQAKRKAANEQKYRERMQKQFEGKYGKPADSLTARNARASGYKPQSGSGSSFVLPQKE